MKEYEFLGTSISYSEKELLALEQEHDKEIDSFVQQLIIDGYFDEDWENDNDDNDTENEEDQTESETDIDIESESEDDDDDDDDEHNKENKCIPFNVKSQTINLNKNVRINYKAKESKISSSHNKQIPLHSIHCFYSMQMKIKFKGIYIDNINMVN